MNRYTLALLLLLPACGAADDPIVAEPATVARPPTAGAQSVAAEPVCTDKLALHGGARECATQADCAVGDNCGESDTCYICEAGCCKALWEHEALRWPDSGQILISVELPPGSPDDMYHPDDVSVWVGKSCDDMRINRLRGSADFSTLIPFNVSVFVVATVGAKSACVDGLMAIDDKPADVFANDPRIVHADIYADDWR